MHLWLWHFIPQRRWGFVLIKQLGKWKSPWLLNMTHQTQEKLTIWTTVKEHGTTSSLVSTLLATIDVDSSKSDNCLWMSKDKLTPIIKQWPSSNEADCEQNDTRLWKHYLPLQSMITEISGVRLHFLSVFTFT